MKQLRITHANASETRGSKVMFYSNNRILRFGFVLRIIT